MNKYTVHIVVDGKDVDEQVLASSNYGAEHMVLEVYKNKGRTAFVIWVEEGWK